MKFFRKSYVLKNEFITPFSLKIKADMLSCFSCYEKCSRAVDSAPGLAPSLFVRPVLWPQSPLQLAAGFFFSWKTLL